MTDSTSTPAKSGQSRGRISAQLKQAIELMIVDGLERADAADQASMTDHGLREALKKDHVRAYRRKREQDYLKRVGNEGVRRARDLMHNAKSEHVQADMARFLAPLSEDFRKQRGDSDGGGAGVSVTLALQGIQAQQIPQGWRPPQGASVPEHMVADQGGEDQAAVTQSSDVGAVRIEAPQASQKAAQSASSRK